MSSLLLRRRMMMMKSQTAPQPQFIFPNMAFSPHGRGINVLVESVGTAVVIIPYDVSKRRGHVGYYVRTIERLWCGEIVDKLGIDGTYSFINYGYSGTRTDRYAFDKGNVTFLTFPCDENGVIPSECAFMDYTTGEYLFKDGVVYPDWIPE